MQLFFISSCTSYSNPIFTQETQCRHLDYCVSFFSWISQNSGKIKKQILLFILAYIIPDTDSFHIPEGWLLYEVENSEITFVNIAVNSWMPLEIKITSLNYTKKLKGSK